MQIENHKVVSFTYVILDEDGNVLEQADVPISYVHGIDSGLFDKLVQALEGRRVGDTVEVVLEPEEAFGQPDPSLIVQDDVENVPPEFQRVGAEAVFENDRGEALTLIVTRVADGKVTLDGNHPLAGKRLKYKLSVADIRNATLEEIGNGLAQGGGLH